MRWFAFLLLVTSATCTAQRVAVSVSGDGDTSLWQDVLTAALTEVRPATEIVERTELARLWRERETTASPARPVNVDHYLHFRQVTDRHWIITLIDAASGRDLGSLAADAVSQADCAPLATAAAHLLDNIAASRDSQKRGSRIAVVEADSAIGDTALFTLAARLRSALADENILVVDRTLTQALAVEGNDAARGFRAAPADGMLLGLDHWIELSARDARLVRARDGVVLGVTPLQADDPDETNRLQSWVLPLLGRAQEQPFSVYLPQVEIEALAPYHRGIGRHDGGDYAGAIIEFTRAYRLNGRFRQAYEWAARSYDALGMQTVGSAIRRYLDTEFLENLHAATGHVTATDGVAFLGIQSPDSLQPLALDLSAVTASALARRPEIGLRLPEQLQRLRREYDWMSLENAEPGRDISNAPSMLTRFMLSGRLVQGEDRLMIRWTLRDSFGLLEPLTRSLDLHDDAATRNDDLNDWLRHWPKPDQLTTPKFEARKADGPAMAESPEEVTARLIAADGDEAEVLRLRLMRLAPDSPLAATRGAGLHDEPLASFIDHGRRDYLISRLPAGHTQRRWLELMRALDHRDPHDGARVFSGRSLEPLGALEDLARQRADDGPGLLARYYLVFYGQAERPPAETVRMCSDLGEELKARPDLMPDIRDELSKAITGLALLAEIATGNHEDGGAAPDTKAAIPFEAGDLVWSADGRLRLEFKRYRLLPNPLLGLSGADLTRNARAQLTLNAYLKSERFCEPAWLSQFPRTRTLTNRIVRALTNAEAAAVGLLEGPDGEAVRNDHWFACIDYAVDNIVHEFTTLTDYDSLRHTQYMAMGLLAGIGNNRLSEVVDERRFDQIRDRMLAAFDQVKSVRPVTNYNSNTHELREITRELVMARHADLLDDSLLWLPDTAVIEDKLRRRESGFIAQNGKPANPYNWWWLALRWETEKAFSAVDRAALLVRCLEPILQAMPEDPDAKQANQHFDLALALLYGREYHAAESLFRRLSALPVDADADRQRRTLVANSLFRLAQTQHVSGRKPEALENAARGLALVANEPLDCYHQSHDYMHNEADLAARLSRLVVDLRFDPARASLPDRVSHVSVPTVNADNPSLCVYYRQPPAGLDQSARAAPRVLILAPTTNEDPLHHLSAGSAWSRFADEHHLVLVAPRFTTSDYAFRHDHAFTHQRYAQAWSGDAVLRAIDEIGRRIPLNADKLLVHGQTSGGGFATHFAAWKPDRVAAVSVINSNWGVARLNETGLSAPSSQRHIRYWVAANPLDDIDMPRARRRYIQQVDLVARLRHAGVPVEWSEWPDPNHTPAPEAEEAARMFLARQLSP